MKTKVIITDDDKMVLFIQEKMFKNVGISSSPLKFNSGNDTLSYLHENYDSYDFFVIFLDINMPYMSGWEFLTLATKFDVKDKVKVFMVSSSIDSNDIERAKSSPLVLDYLIKPVSSSRLTELKETYDFLKN